MKKMDYYQIKTNLKIFLTELEEVCKKCGRKREEVKVVFATKYLEPEEFVSFIDMVRGIGIEPILIGENRVQEAEEKFNHLSGSGGDLKFIMIGNLQKNKINKALRIFEEIDSIDSLLLAEEIDKRIASPVFKTKVMPIFLEVNVAGEKTKHGFRVEEIEAAIKAIKQYRHLAIKGLMTMAPYLDDPEKARPIFRKLRQLADRYSLLTSMGMSHDWQQAVEEGADLIRIGSKIFR